MYDLVTRETMNEQSSRGVAPVIAVILMVAITVILASVVAVFVLDIGGGLSEDAQAGLNIDQNVDDETVTVEIISIGNVAHIEMRGDTDFNSEPDWSSELGESGDKMVLDRGGALADQDQGTLRAVGVTPEGEESVVNTFDWDFEG